MNEAHSQRASAALSLWCDHRDGEKTRTAGTQITYGPDFTDLPLHEQIGLAAHHVLHVALHHFARLSDLAARYSTGFDGSLSPGITLLRSLRTGTGVYGKLEHLAE